MILEIISERKEMTQIVKKSSHGTTNSSGITQDHAVKQLSWNLMKTPPEHTKESFSLLYSVIK